MVTLICIVGFYEFYLIYTIFESIRSKSLKLRDGIDNSIKGAIAAPDKDSERSVGDDIIAKMNALLNILDGDGVDKEIVLNNLKNQFARQEYAKFETLENKFNIAVTIADLMTILGVMGTMMSLGFALNGVTVEEFGDANLLAGFSTALNTTIVAIFFSFISSLVLARLQSPFSRLKEVLKTYRKILERYASHEAPVDLSVISKRKAVSNA